MADEKELEILEKLRKIIEDKEEEDLSEEELDTVRNMISMYRSFEAFGRFSKTMRNLIIFVGGLLIAWFTLLDNTKLLWQKLLALVGS